MKDFKMDYTGFSMSKFARKEDLYLAMAKHYQEKCKELEKFEAVATEYNDLDQNNICDLVAMLERISLTGEYSNVEIDDLLDRVKGIK